MYFQVLLLLMPATGCDEDWWRESSLHAKEAKHLDPRLEVGGGDISRICSKKKKKKKLLKFSYKFSQKVFVVLGNSYHAEACSFQVFIFNGFSHILENTYINNTSEYIEETD